MTEKQKPARKNLNSSNKETSPRSAAESSEEANFWAALEQARQNVKPIVRKEREAELVSAELLNLRLKAR